jgi:hypothetical protein
MDTKVGNVLAKGTALLMNLNIEYAPVTSHRHTHPSLSQTSRLLSTSPFLGFPFPRPPSVCETFTSRFSF